MRKLWFRRRAVSTMIGGIIVLALLMTALSAMILVSRQYDAYQRIIDKMGERDQDAFTENIVGMYPGLQLQSGPSGLNQYAMNLSNYGNGAQIARIYINSTAAGGCFPTICIFDSSSTPAAYKFQGSSRYINAGEFFHTVVLWLPSTVKLPTTPGANSVIIVTTMGRVFSFHSPFQVVGPAAPGGGSGGTGINIGPLVIHYRSVLITFTDVSGSSTFGPPTPIDNGWVFPSGSNTYIIFFVKISNQANVPVTITRQSLIQLTQFGAPGNQPAFYLVAPMATSLCQSLATFPLDSTLYCQETSTAAGAYSTGNTYPTNTGTVTAYKFNDTGAHPYIVPPSSKNNVCCGPPIYLLFSASTVGGNSAGKISIQSGHPQVFYTFLNIVFLYNGYFYGVNFPFLTFCASTSSPDPGSFSQSCPP